MFRFFIVALAVLPVLTGKQPLDILDAGIYSKSKDAQADRMFLGQVLSKQHMVLLTEKDKILTQRVLQEALETSPSFVEHKWMNASNDHKGVISVGPTEEMLGEKCRRFSVVIQVNDQKIYVSGKACRNESEPKWEILGEQAES